MRYLACEALEWSKFMGVLLFMGTLFLIFQMFLLCLRIVWAIKYREKTKYYR